MNISTILLHLSLIDGIGPITIKKIVQKREEARFDLQNLYRLSKADLVQQFGFSLPLATKLYTGLCDHTRLQKECELMVKHNIQYVSLACSGYPELLKHIYAPPAVLYVKGTIELFKHEKKIAFVGSRKAHRYGEKIVEDIVPQMVQQGWVIVSGGALGADSMAHRVTLQSEGKTIAILGSGLLRPYPASNERLFDEMVEKGGAVVTIFPLETFARPGNFPARNRIIAGLSMGCVVVQAAAKSGACITAQSALDEGRHVFAVPGPIDDKLSAGCHWLIQQGAKLVGNASDILYDLPDYLSQANNKEVASVEDDGKGHQAVSCTKSLVQMNRFKKNRLTKSLHFDDNTSNGLSRSEAEIINCCKIPCSLDEILQATNMELDELHKLLFEMQLKGQIIQNFAGMFERGTK